MSIAFFGCSKKETIDYIPEERDTVEWRYSHNLVGIYSGELFWLRDSMGTTYKTLPYSMELVISEISYSKVRLSKIEYFLNSGGCEANVAREGDHAFLRFDETTMDTTLAVDSVYQNYYNAIWLKDDASLQYFIHYYWWDTSFSQGVDTVRFLFEGKRK